MVLSKKEFKELLDKGFIHFYAVFEVVGNPADYVEKSIKIYINKMKLLQGIKVITEKISTTKKLENQDLWGVFAEVEFLAENLERFNWLCINFLPSSVEVLSPKEFYLDNLKLAKLLNDFVAKLHAIDGFAKALKLEKHRTEIAFNILARNLIAVALKDGGKTPLQLSKITGISVEDIKKFLDVMIKEKKVRLQDNKYELMHKTNA